MCVGGAETGGGERQAGGLGGGWWAEIKEKESERQTDGEEKQDKAQAEWRGRETGEPMFWGLTVNVLMKICMASR